MYIDVIKKTVIFLLLCVVTQIHAVDIDSLFTAGELTQIHSGKILTRMYLKYNAKGENTHLKFTLSAIEAIPDEMADWEMLTDEKAFIPWIRGEDGLLPVINTLVNFDGLAGTPYWSRRAGKVETLILESTGVVSESDKTPVSSLRYETVPEAATHWFIQKDNKFGRTGYRYSFTVTGDVIIIDAACFHPIIFKKLIAVNEKEETRVITILVYDDAAQGFYYYALYGMRIKLDMLLKSGALRPTSFSNRLRAATVHLATALGNDWHDRLNPWDEKLLKAGKYRQYNLIK